MKPVKVRKNHVSLIWHIIPAVLEMPQSGMRTMSFGRREKDMLSLLVPSVSVRSSWVAVFFLPRGTKEQVLRELGVFHGACSALLCARSGCRFGRC